MQNTLSVLSCTEEVTRIPNESQHTSLFHMLKMPYFPHSAACARNVTRATQLLTPSATHSFPKKLIYSNRLQFIHPTVFIGSFSPLSSCKLDLRIMHICTPYKCMEYNLYICTPYKRTSLTRSCWYFLRAGTRGIFFESLRQTVS